jgi:Flp pilus assembly protein TadG
MGSRALRQRRSGDEGAGAVEFALLFPLFIMLAIGTISAGFAFHAWLSVTHGAQETSRFAATLGVDASGGTTTEWLDSVADRALAASDLMTDATHAIPGSRICVAVVSPTNIPLLNNHLVITADSTGQIVRGAAASGPCPGLSTMSGDYVQVEVTRPTNFNYVFAAATINVGKSSVNRYEAVSLS